METAVIGSHWLAQEPPAIPVPTVVVEPQVTIPPDLLERLTPTVQSGIFGLTQPTATICAALIAVVAAIIAYRGVLKQIRSARDNVAWQMDVDREMDLRERKYRVINDGLATLMEARHALVLFRNAGGETPPTGALFAKVLASAQSWTLVSVQLTAFGLAEAAKVFDDARKPYETALNTSDIREDFRTKFSLFEDAADAAGGKLKTDAVALANQPLPSDPRSKNTWEFKLPLRFSIRRRPK